MSIVVYGDTSTSPELRNESLGHGVGLEIHERPFLARSTDVLLAGDVITLEPGLYRDGFGGCRLEDLVLVGDTCGQPLTDFPYSLVP
jgi:Xaa-Pro aminopeptidase